MFKKNLLALALLALPLEALPQSQEQLIERYTALAGSRQNATSLVSGLREGKQVTLTRGTTTETFTPPTGKMGYGNVDHALALAGASLKEQGITRPTPLQLERATVEILGQRANGMGWGEIARSQGFKLGELKRPERVAAAERPNKPERPERPEKPERPERPEKPERPGKGR
jgi:hypothetical protein